MRTFITAGGLGDVLIATAGMHAAYTAKPEAFQAGATLYVKGVLKDLCAALLPELTVAPSAERPRHGASYQVFTNTTWKKTLKNVLSGSYYINIPDRRRWVFGLEPKYSFGKRLQIAISNLAIDRRVNWRRETPIYYGLKMWAPFAQANDICEVALLNAHYRSLPILRERLLAYAGKLPPAPSYKLIFFANGKSFQYAPPAFIAKLVEALGLSADSYCCYFSANDEQELATYRAHGLHCESIDSIDSTIAAIAAAQVTVTVDSFAGHVAQLCAKNHVLLLSRELPDEVVHPAAPSIRIFEAQKCTPCMYELRTEAETCPAGLKHCGVFNSDSYTQQAIRQIRACLSV